ncbi:TetR/AcrR family transcriptional regulator [Marinobacter confluentis]|uniref:TetR/AcrR family transcriptional regulator n=1 Tax=Marinobacter confluentis TaxID=1697557 RepID=A0A4Z1CA89_9GAMM|nr:TetR/AcrR family transcriptional regulator [Marinobacter confluentis]TGN40456.1 TetR/AcrR family transcriptional regulator [Marinobacter confluentis]
MRKKTEGAEQPVKTPPASILRKVVNDALEHGYVFRSMRAIAETSGISHRMLNYHFGSQYGLWAAIIGEVRGSESALFKAETELVNSVDDLKAFFLTFWRRYTTTEFRAFYQLHFETYSYALRHREECADFLSGVVEPWVGAISELFRKVGFTEQQANERARIMLAAMRGFTLDFLTTGDAGQIENAGRTLLDLVCAPPKDRADQ